MFELEYMGGEKYQFQQGANFALNGRFEAVVGASAARKTGLAVGKTFRSMHGESESSETEHDQPVDFTVVGVLKPTGTPSDQAIYVNLAGFYHLHEFAEFYYELRTAQTSGLFPIGSALPEMFEKGFGARRGEIQVCCRQQPPRKSPLRGGYWGGRRREGAAETGRHGFPDFGGHRAEPESYLQDRRRAGSHR